MRHLLAILVVAVLVTSSLAQSGGLINGTRGIPYPNDATGTTLWGTAIITTAGAAETAPANATGPVRIVVGGAGASGNAVLASAGTLAPCTMDAAVSTAGNFFVIAGAAGQCHPQSAAPASGTWVIGYLHDPTTTVGSQSLVHVNGFFYGGTGGSGSGTVNANNGTAGAIGYYVAAGGSTTVDASPGAITGSTGINLASNSLMFGTFTTPNLYLSNFFGNGVLSVGTSVGSNGSMITTGNSVAIGTDLAFSTTMANVMSKSLPARANVWIIHCALPFSFTTGNTGTSTINFRLNLAQIPAAGTYFTSVLWGSGTSPIFGTTLVSATGITNIGVAASLDSTVTTTVYTMFLDGALSANSTAQTVQVQAITTSGAAVVRAGAYCRLE